MKDQRAGAFTGASVLVTGGTGTIGRAVVDLALRSGARRVVVFSRDETKQARMRAETDDPRLRFVLGDVRDAATVGFACSGVELVLHAAAMKRVDACEEHPEEAVAVNVIGSLNVARACTQGVLVSTDKAVDPVGVYGATKLLAERAWIARGLGVARLGNVLGSTGSVLDLWRRCLARGEALPVTDPSFTRFWTTPHGAAETILTAAEHSGVTVPLLGASTVDTLATALGLAEGRTNVETRRVDVRPGETAHESLVAGDERRYAAHGSSAGRGGVYWLLHRGEGDAPVVYRSDVEAPRLSAEELAKMIRSVSP